MEDLLPAPAINAGCAVMRVAYAAREACLRMSAADAIRIVIPASVRGQAVTVIPSWTTQMLATQAPDAELTPADAVAIALDEPFFRQQARETLGGDATLLRERQTAQDVFMHEVGNTLRHGLRAQHSAAPRYLESLAVLIAVHLALNYCEAAARAPCGGSLAPKKLQRVQAFVQTHLADAVRVQQLAAAVHMSPFHFARLFKRATGRTPHDYLTFERMEYAKQLLRSDDLPLIEVAARTGFQTQGHFTSVFHRYTGLTPRMFRVRAHMMTGNAERLFMAREAPARR